MNKFGALRKINKELKYSSITKYIGIEIPVDISNSGEIIAEEIKSLIEEHLNLKIESIKGNNIEGTIAKYGLIDVNFEIEDKIETTNKTGIQILRENGWVEEKKEEEVKEEELGFLEDILSEIEDNKTYLKIYANSINQKQKWFKEKSYLLKQMLNGKKLEPLPEDKIQVFRIIDMCYTNYSGIWLWKYFYM